MDAKILISSSINRLQGLLDHESTTKINPRLKKRVEKAIDNLLQLLKDVDHELAGAPSGGSVNDRRNTTFRLLRAVYAVEDAADTFVFTKEFQRIQKVKDKEAREDCPGFIMKMFCCCFCCGFWFDSKESDFLKYFYRQVFFTQKLESFYSWIRFNRKMKKFNDEVRRLVEIEGAGTGTTTLDMETSNNNNISLLRFENYRDQISQRQHWGRISDFCLEEETHVVGLHFQQQIDELVLRLTPRPDHNVGLSRDIKIQDDDDDDHLSTTQVIAVVGEGGSGKTTLARTVYNSIEVKRHFTTRVWVHISSMSNARDVLADILAQTSQADRLVGVATLSHDALMKRLTKLLNGNTFLIVFDDVDSPWFWESFSDILSSSSQGGKLVITTRNKDNHLPLYVARSAINMSRLNDEESWKLFSNKVRIAEDELNKLEVITLKEQIVKVCSGLPLLIVLLGGLLSTKAQSCNKWTRVVSMLANKTIEDVILALSYQDLPSEAKPCFLYMGLFPRGFEIPVRRLIHLWRVEGLMTLPVREEIYSEELAEMCLEELVARNMVQVRWRLDGVPKTCCMPSVLFDFFFPKAANVGFLHHHFQSSHTVAEQQKLAVRRLAAYTGITNVLPTSLHLLRSYVAFDNRVGITPDTSISVLFNKIIADRGFVLLRELDLEGVFKPQIYPILRNLLLLRYLGLRSTFLDSFPPIEGYLPFLDTLDVKHTNIQHIVLEKVNKLQHIYLNYNYKRFSEKFGVNTFPSVSTNLGTLWGLYMNSYDVKKGHYRILFDMRKLTKLKLILSRDRDGPHHDEMEKIAEWINKLSQLQSLKLNFKSVNEGENQPSTFKLKRMADQHKLQELYLIGYLPHSVIGVGFLPPNIKKLTLSLSQLEEDPMPVLEQLPHLNILRLFSGSYKGEQMTCNSKGFPRLRDLKLWKLQVRVWTVEEGAMPCLRELEIRSCENLEMPQGLQNVTTLKELVLTNMTKDFGAAIEKSLDGRDVYIRNITWNSINPFPEEISLVFQLNLDAAEVRISSSS